MFHNYCIIMAGGVGSRFWPLSTEARPKQFLDVMGTGKSFIRATFERFLPSVPKENFLVVTSAAYKSQVMEHLPELSENQILLEPMRRNTAPCIAYASFRIKTICDNANVVVTPADHLVTNTVEFSRIIDKGLNYAAAHNSILTIGIKPSRPETGYGYIKQDSQTDDNEIYNVDSFKEKPSIDVAKQYISDGNYLWNSGIFIWNNNTILSEFSRQLPDMYSNFQSGCGLYNTEREQEFIDELYPRCQSISIDYGIMEGATNRCVIPADFGWSDIGTWGSLYTHLAKDDNENTSVGAKVVFDKSRGCIVNLPAGHNAIIEGLDGYLVAYNNNNLIVCRLDDEQNIKNLVEKLK